MRVRVVLLLLLLSIGLRLGVVALSIPVAKMQANGAASRVTLSYYSQLHDGREYQAIARAFFSQQKLKRLPAETQRLFPGYPLAIRAMSPMMPMPIAALAIAIVAAGIATLLFYRASGNAWLGAWFAVFTPSWVLYSSVAMSEGLFLALAIGGFCLWMRRNPNASSFVLGLATIVRPVGALVFAACWIASAVERGQISRKVAVLSAMALLFLIAPLAWMLAAWIVWDDPLRQFHSYVTKDYTLPFVSLARGMLSGQIGLPKKILVGFTLLIHLVAAIELFRRYWQSRTSRDMAYLLWMLLMALFYLGLPSEWTFGSLDRFFVTAAPPLIVGLDRFLPRKTAVIAVVAAVSVAICVYWNANLLMVWLSRL